MTPDATHRLRVLLSIASVWHALALPIRFAFAMH
jgi:hypothetical protein